MLHKSETLTQIPTILEKNTRFWYIFGSANVPKRNQVKPKSQKSIKFIEELHKHIIKSPLLRQNVHNKNESQIQTELRPIIFNYANEYLDVYHG